MQREGEEEQKTNRIEQNPAKQWRGKGARCSLGLQGSLVGLFLVSWSCHERVLEI